MAAVSLADNRLTGRSYFYHNNNQLKHVLEYENGRLWNVLAYFDQSGNVLDAGDFCDGEGTLNVYSSTGVLIKTKLYKKGKEKRSSNVE